MNLPKTIKYNKKNITTKTRPIQNQSINTIIPAKIHKTNKNEAN